MCNISILVLTKNEEKDLPKCLKSVSWSDDIHVYDSFSTDETINIAKSFGANITQRVFDNWASHQNWGLKNINFKHKWVFYIDADEVMSEELRNEIQKIAQIQDDINVAYKVQRRDFFMGTWLKHVQTSPFYMRFFIPKYMRYERLVNPISIADGNVGKAHGFLDHFPFSKGVTHWLDRHNSYSTLEAKQIIENRRNSSKFSIVSAFTEKDFHKKRFHQKELFYRAPFRPAIKFIILYFIKMGFLDGKAGLTYATLQAIYEYMIVIKTKEFFDE